MSKLNLLRQEFLKELHILANYTGDWRQLNSRPLMSATYEYFRNRHVENVVDFTAEEESQLKENLPKAYFQLGSQGALSYLIDYLERKEVFNYVRFRSACQFLIDDVGTFVPGSREKDEQIEEMLASFEDNDKYLELAGDDWEFCEYPVEPVPEHAGVPESHTWWKRLEDSYGPFLQRYG
uniref:SMI1/KNR4 family protein n=1 Tax=Panagrellus redivivus TaxID=6233 RepID=A0A7E4VQ79_PANRE